MPNFIFNFTFNLHALFPLSAVIINILLIVFMWRRNLSQAVSLWMTFFLSFVIIWGVGQFFTRLSSTTTAAIFWSNIAPIGWVFVPIAFFGFVLVFTGRDKIFANPFFPLLFWGQGIVFLFLVWNTYTLIVFDPTLMQRMNWGWDIPYGPLFFIFFIWAEAYILSGFVLLFQYWRNVTDQHIKIQTLLILFAFIPPIIFGSITDMGAPMLGFTTMGLSVFLTGLFSPVIFYAIVRYGLFVIGPRETLAYLVDAMDEAMIVLGPHYTIVASNRAAENLFGYSGKEFYGKRLSDILPQEEREHFQKEVTTTLRKGKRVVDVRLSLKNKQEGFIPVRVSASPIKAGGAEDKLGGMIVLISDVSENEELIKKENEELIKKLEVISRELTLSQYTIEKQLSKIVSIAPRE